MSYSSVCARWYGDYAVLQRARKDVIGHQCYETHIGEDSSDVLVPFASGMLHLVGHQVSVVFVVGFDSDCSVAYLAKHHSW